MKEIDDIFRQKLKEVDYPFEEEHWEALEERLPERKRRWLPWSLVAGILILVGLFFIYKDEKIKKTFKAVLNTKEKNSGISTKIPKKALVADSLNLAKQSHNQLIYDDENDKSHLAIKRESRLSREAMRLGESDKGEIKNYLQHSLSILPDKSGSLQQDSLKVLGSLDQDSRRLTMLILEKLPASRVASVFHSPEIHAAVQVHSEKQKIINRSKDVGSLAMVVAPDLTSVRGAGESRISSNFGVLYTRPIGKRWSISAGLLYSQKRYTSPYSFYQPSNPITGAYLPTDVRAICQVISVPVTVNYTAWKKKGQLLQLNAGASSYFMLKEKYNMRYETGYEHVYEFKGENQHYLGIADLSITYLRKIHPNYHLGIRPFVQIPLQGIGYGNIPLQSQGVALIFGINK